MTTNKRDYLFDNIKGYLIFLVTWVHLCAATMSLSKSNIYIEVLLMIVCSFHMPLFMFITGFFSKHTTKAKLNILLIQYLLISILFFVFDVFVTKEIPLYKYSLWKFISPGFSMWYIFAIIILKFFFMEMPQISKGLFFIFIASILIMASPMKGAIDVAIVKAIANSFYFALGYVCTKETIKKIRLQNKLFFVIPFIFMIASMIYIGVFRLNYKQVHHLRIMMLRSENTSQLSSDLFGFGIFTLITLIAIVMSVCIIRIAPECQTIFSKYGKNSLTIYIAQAFAYKLYMKYYYSIFEGEYIHYVVATFISIIIFVIFGSNIVKNAFNYSVEFLTNLLKKIG